MEKAKELFNILRSKVASCFSFFVDSYYEIRSDREQKRRLAKKVPPWRVDEQKKSSTKVVTELPQAEPKYHLNQNDPKYPAWPSFYIQKRNGVSAHVVSGRCQSLVSDDLCVGLGCGASFLLFCFGGVVSVVIGMSDNPIPVIMLSCMLGVGVYLYARYFHGKDVEVAFTAETITINGTLPSQWNSISGISFHMRQHEKIRLQKPARPDERRRMLDYREVVMEYGLQTIPVCEVANLEKAQLFTRVLQEAYKLSRENKYPSNSVTSNSKQSRDEILE